jgi:hypothetical protein
VQSGDFTADFYNNVAAIAIVLMVTKVLSHRTRKVPRKPKAMRTLARVHVLAVAAAATAVAISLAATDFKLTGIGVRITAWTALGIAGGLLILDIVIDEMPHLRSTHETVADSSDR